MINNNQKKLFERVKNFVKPTSLPFLHLKLVRYNPKNNASISPYILEFTLDYSGKVSHLNQVTDGMPCVRKKTITALC